MSTYAGFGQANAGKKFRSIFNSENEKENKSESISDEQKMKEINEIQDRIRNI